MTALRGIILAALASIALVASGCASEDTAVEEEPGVASTDDELRSAPLGRTDMVQIETPPGMPKPWTQPDSDGRFGQHGKCGATAVANTLALYGTQVSPEQAEADGVRWLIGARADTLEDYYDKHQPQLGCDVSHPWNGIEFLRNQLEDGHPVSVWFNTPEILTSHWVVVVGLRGDGDAAKAVVMSWGRYYEISLAKLEKAWRWVYGFRHPAIVCDATTKLIVK